MILEKQVISVEKVNHIGDFKLELQFNDKTCQVIDFYPFLSSSLNPLIRKYLSPEEWEVERGDDLSNVILKDRLKKAIARINTGCCF